MNRLDKPFKIGDRVVVSGTLYRDLPVGTTGTVARIPQERWYSNEVTVAWDDGERSTLGCFVLDKTEALPAE
jgi:hypothetical protein